MVSSNPHPHETNGTIDLFPFNNAQQKFFVEHLSDVVVEPKGGEVELGM
jgi:hypothetical protein